MGRLFGRWFSEAGHSVAVPDKTSRRRLSGSIGEHDIIVLAVPISAMAGVVEELGPLTDHDGAVIDIASVKAGPIDSMLRYCKGEVIGTHPMFGPNVESLAGQIVFVCPARSGRWTVWYRSFLESSGATVVEIEPGRHDRIMAVAQVLRHLLLLCMGQSMMRLEFDPGSDLPFVGPWTSTLAAMIRHQLSQPPELYAEIALHNPYSPRVAREFLAAATGLCASYATGDRDSLVQAITEISAYLESGAANDIQ